MAMRLVGVSNGGRIHGASMVLAFACLYAGRQYASAASSADIVIAEIPFGEAAGQLGFTKGDTRAYDQFAVLTAVDGAGRAYVDDEVNARKVILGPGGKVVRIHGRGGMFPYALGLMPLVPSGYVGQYRADLAGTDRARFRLRMHSGDGSVLYDREAPLLEFVAPLQGGGFLARDFGAARSKGPFYEFGADCRIKQRHETPPAPLMAPRSLKDTSVVEIGGSCFVLPRSEVGGWHQVVQAPSGLRFIGPNGPAELRADGTLVRWTVPPGEVFEPDLSDDPNRALIEDGATEYLEVATSQVFGLDGNYYNLLYTPGRYELVRVVLSQLPTTVIQPIPNTPPTIVFDGPTTVAAGSKLRIWVRGHDAEPGTLALSAVDLPVGATFRQSRRGNTAALDWTPNAEQVGDHTVNITARDPMCGQTTQALKITVEPSE